MQSTNTKNLILEHFNKYPKMQIRDAFKFLFQSAFGCEHLVLSFEKTRDYIVSELSSLNSTCHEVEKLDGAYSRVHLGILKDGLSCSTFAMLFYLSAKKEDNAIKNLEQKLEILKQMIINNELPFALEDYTNFLTLWQQNNYCLISHSAIFKENYSPSYRVISNEFISLLPLLKTIDLNLEKNKQKNFKINVDNYCEQKQAFILNKLKQIYPNTVEFCFDDFNDKKCLIVFEKE